MRRRVSHYRQDSGLVDELSVEALSRAHGSSAQKGHGSLGKWRDGDWGFVEC